MINPNRWALPSDHPILVALMDEIKRLKASEENLQLVNAMCVREISKLREHVAKDVIKAIAKEVWGSSRVKRISIY